MNYSAENIVARIRLLIILLHLPIVPSSYAGSFNNYKHNNAVKLTLTFLILQIPIIRRAKKFLLLFMTYWTTRMEMFCLRY